MRLRRWTNALRYNAIGPEFYLLISVYQGHETGRGPEDCVENGLAVALVVGYVSIQICALLAPCWRPFLNATMSSLYARRYTRAADRVRSPSGLSTMVASKSYSHHFFCF